MGLLISQQVQTKPAGMLFFFGGGSVWVGDFKTQTDGGHVFHLHAAVKGLFQGGSFYNMGIFFFLHRK